MEMEYSKSIGLEETLVDASDIQSPNDSLATPIFDSLAPPTFEGGDRSHSPLSQASMDSCHNGECPEELGSMDVVVKKMAKDLKIDESLTGQYDMARSPRGLALIIEIEEYVNRVEEKRIGSHVDVENLQKLFKQFHFKTIHKKNLSYMDFNRALRDFATNPEHSDSDMMILAVLSHGRDGQVIASDGRVIETEAIYALFNNANCPRLTGKPKFFIVQACRGDDTDKVSLQALEDEEMYEDLNNRKRKRTFGTDTIPITQYIGELNAARPTWEDMIIAYSTIPGFTSQRDHEKGTWFIQSLVTVFMNHAHDTEIIDLLRMTSSHLSKFSNAKGEKQTCNVELRHLYKKLYFKPGFQDRNLRRCFSTPPASPSHRVQEID